MWQNGSSPLGKFQRIVSNLPNSELQETHFHAFYPLTSLLLWQTFLITLFSSFLDYFIVLYLSFYISR